MGAAVLIGAIPGRVSAQARTDDRAWYQRLTDGMAGVVYWAAWPTATYERIVTQDVAFTAEGAEVTFRLHGASAFADGDLWVDVKLTMRRSGEITNLEWGDYNGFFPPGFTWKEGRKLAAEINRRNGIAAGGTRAAAAPPPLTGLPIQTTALCLSNTTTNDVPYSIKWGVKSESLTLKAGQRWRFWVPAATGAKFEISFDQDLTPSVSPKAMTITGVTVSGEPALCTDLMTLDFVESQQRLGLGTHAWVPGFPHPFIPDLLAAEEKDQWSCAAGFKFAGPVNPQNVECIDQNVGLTGMTLSTKPTTPFAEVAGITAGWPAAEAGIAAGTYIVSVDGVSTDGLTTAAVIARIRGNMGATVRLGIVAPGAAPRVVVLTRR